MIFESLVSLADPYFANDKQKSTIKPMMHQLFTAVITNTSAKLARRLTVDELIERTRLEALKILPESFTKAWPQGAFFAKKILGLKGSNKLTDFAGL